MSLYNRIPCEVKIGLDISTLEVVVYTTTNLVSFIDDVWDPRVLYRPSDIVLSKSFKATPSASRDVGISVQAVKAFIFYS